MTLGKDMILIWQCQKCGKTNDNNRKQASMEVPQNTMQHERPS